MKRRKNRFGINMMRCCREHEAYIRSRFGTGTDLRELLDYHDRKIGWLQHERFVHLLVTMLTALVFLFVFSLALVLKGSPPVLVLLALMTVLLAAYLFHYFRLENTVQRWYILSDEIYQKLNQ